MAQKVARKFPLSQMEATLVKAFARKNKTSISAIVDNFLVALVKREKRKTKSPSRAKQAA